MSLTDLLSPSDVVLDLVAPEKPRLLRELSARAAEKTGLDAGLVLAEVEKREQLGSTGVGRGIAIPHARVTGLGRPAAIVARLRRPIDFDAIDGEPVDLVTLLLLPASQDGGQINITAAIARLLRDPEIVARARSAPTARDFYEALKQGS